MAAPITIGELTDVPAPQSPVNAQFHQEVANRICHRFANTAAMNGWAAGNGSLAFDAQTNKHYIRRSGVWQPLIYEGQAGVITNAMLAADSVTAAKIAVDAVGTSELAPSAVTSNNILDRTIVAADLATSVLESAWVQSDHTGSNWAGESGWLKKIGNIVWFRFQGTANAAGTAVGFIPSAAYRPGTTYYIPCIDISTGAGISWAVQANGQFTASASMVVGHTYTATGLWPVTP